MENKKTIETPEEAYESAVLALASFRLIREEIPGETGEWDENKGFDQKILRQIDAQLKHRRGEAKNRRTNVCVLRTALIALVAVNLLATVAFSVSPGVRSGVYRFFSSDMGTPTELGFLPDKTADVPSGWEGDYYPVYLPDMKWKIAQIQPNRIEWESEDGAYLSFGVFDTAWQVSIDTEGYEYHKIYDRQWREYDLYVNEDWAVAIWNEGDLFFIVSSCELSEKETVRIAESVCPVNK